MTDGVTNPMDSPVTQGEILVVDDTPASLKLLSDLLTGAGYSVREAPNGELALWTAAVRVPDLILLDVRMPGINGIEVCRRLKLDPKTASVPVIFLSAQSDADDKIEGFGVGAVDYVGKPYAPGEVLARVKTHVTLVRLSKELNHERQSLEVKVRQRTADLQALLDAAVEFAIISTDPQGRITVFNRGAEKMLGYTEQEVLGKSMALWHRDSEIKIRAKQLATTLGHPVEDFEIFVALVRDGATDLNNWTFVCKDGHTLRVSLAVSAVRNEVGDVMGFLGIARDVTAQLAAEANLLKLNLQLDTRVKERTEELQQALDDLHMTQAKLVQSEKLVALGSIVAAVAHELNTPIGNCTTVASTLADETEAMVENIASGLRRSQLDGYMDAMRKGMKILLRALDRAAVLVNNFKQVAASQSAFERRQFNLSNVIGDIATQLEITLRATPFRLELDIAPDVEMDSYPDALEQIVSRLVNNAVVHAFAGRDHGSMRLNARAGGDGVRLVFSDDGVGMTEHVRQHIFDPFFTTQLGKGGSGLGMSICYNVITGPLGGSIEVTSVGGGGSTFTIDLPRTSPVA